MIGKAPIDVADQRNGHVVEADFDLLLIAVRRAVLLEFSKCTANPARELLALVFAARIGAECRLPDEFVLGAFDAFLNREAWIGEPEVNPVLHGFAARR